MLFTLFGSVAENGVPIGGIFAGDISESGGIAGDLFKGIAVGKCDFESAVAAHGKSGNEVILAL